MTKIKRIKIFKLTLKKPKCKKLHKGLIMNILIYFLLVLSFPLFANDSELKIKDLNHSEVGTLNSSEPSETLSAEQIENLKKDVNLLKEKQKQSEEMLELLDKEI